MPFVRLSLMTPKPGQTQRASELLDRLIDFYQRRPGFVAAYRLTPDGTGAPGRIGRVSIWEHKEDANHTAAEQTDISLQSELKLISEEETHEEHSFEGVGGVAKR